MDVVEALKLVIPAFFSIGGAALIAHRFAVAVESKLQVFGVRLDNVVTNLTALTTDVKNADVSVLRERVKENRLFMGKIQDELGKISGIEQKMAILAGAVGRIETIDREVTALREKHDEVAKAHGSVELRLSMIERDAEREKDHNGRK